MPELPQAVESQQKRRLGGIDAGVRFAGNDKTAIVAHVDSSQARPVAAVPWTRRRSCRPGQCLTRAVGSASDSSTPLGRRNAAAVPATVAALATCGTVLSDASHRIRVGLIVANDKVSTIALR